MESIYLGLFWMFYYTLHSAFATERVKQFFKRRAPSIYSYYRLLFTFFSTFNFVLLAWFHHLISSNFVFEPTSITLILGGILMTGGMAVTLSALKNYRWQVWFWEEETESDRLITTGLNAIVRHPLYFGAILMIIGFFLVSPMWKNGVFLIVTLLYLVIGTLFEEQKLLSRFGLEYEKYRKRVKMLIPYLV